MLPQVRAVALSRYIEVAQSVGLDPYAMLRRRGINPSVLLEPDHPLPAEPVAALLEDSARESGCESFGLLLVEARSVESVGAIGLLLRHQATLREILAAIVRYQNLLAGALAMSVEPCGQTQILRIDFNDGLGRRQPLETALGMTCRVIRAAMHGGQPECVHFGHDAPQDLSVHHRVFQCPLAFRSEFNGLVYPSALLDAPNPGAAPVMARHAQRYLDMLVPEPTAGAIAFRAKRSLSLLLPTGRASLEQVGANMGLHPRALQRMLEKEGQTFASVLNDVRRQLAQRYLSNSAHNVTAIAQLTGYSSLSSFTRWFRAEFGIAPLAWRAGARGGAEGAATGAQPPTML